MKTAIEVCDECDGQFIGGEADEHGLIDGAVEQCGYCERFLCARCFRLHECNGHDPETVLCVSCVVEIEISNTKNHEMLPARIDGDPVCAKCAFERPWEKKKGGTRP